MKSRFLTCTALMTLIAVLVLPLRPAAQNIPAHPTRHHYKLIDLGRFGGPQSWVFGAQEAPAATLSTAGVVGGADTADSNPNYPNFSPLMGVGGLFGYAGPFINHAFKGDKGGLIDLGVLPGGYNSFAQWISTNGTIVGASENGAIDPITAWPVVHAVLWPKNGHSIIDLGTLPGAYESTALAVNNLNQVVGAAIDAAGNGRGFWWTKKKGLQDIGTLGGCCAIATLVNDLGQVAGASGACDSCNQDSFFWEKGHMTPIPDFGGPLSFPDSLNNSGQVVGQSDLPGGGTAHAFLWEKGILTDLGTLPGGDGSSARWINEAGDIVGLSQAGMIYHAVLWKRQGKHFKITDLGTIDPCSIAQSINLEGQIVGESENCDGIPRHAFLWENGGPIVDLNTVIPPNSGLTLILAVTINDRGEIAGQATDADGNNHAFLLIPRENGVK